MDIFIEQIVAKQSTAKDILLKIGIGLLAAVFSIALMIVSGMFGFGMIGMLLAAGCIYGAFYLISGFNIEYEYIVTNGEIDIDKIFAKRRRKRLITAKASSFEKFGPANEAPASFDGTTIMASSGIANENYYAEFNHSKHGHVRLIFSPNEKVLGAIKPYLPRNIHQNIYQ
jgi:hypothetical protein